ncbi:MAG: hypothetical protein QFX33_05210 [Candidatus Nezhaarchaeota archaeon]|nr:hypothetical protein [Candidatus Nezhaarchaeota archaeon]
MENLKRLRCLSNDVSQKVAECLEEAKGAGLTQVVRVFATIESYLKLVERELDTLAGE